MTKKRGKLKLGNISENEENYVRSDTINVVYSLLIRTAAIRFARQLQGQNQKVIDPTENTHHLINPTPKVFILPSIAHCELISGSIQTYRWYQFTVENQYLT